MKTLAKYTFLLIFVSVTGLLIYQNLEFIMTRTALSLEIEKYQFSWTGPELENGIYLAVCLLFGLFLSAAKGLVVKWGLEKTIREKDNQIQNLENEVSEIAAELDFFTHDPYIKKGLEQNKQQKAATALPEPDMETADLENGSSTQNPAE